MYNNEPIISSIVDCYESIKDYCTFYFYYNLTSNRFYCTENKNCPEDYIKLIEEKKQCVDICERDNIYKYELNNICYNESKIDKSTYKIEKTKSNYAIYNLTETIIDDTKEKNLQSEQITELNNNVIQTEEMTESIIIENRTELINNIIHELIKDFNITDIDSGRDKKIVEKNLIIILTSTLNQKINEDKNNITMNLGQCENILKNEYNISNNDSLYILQVISEETGMKIPKIEYEIYYPLYNSQNLTKLNLTSCKNSKIEISISVKINDTLDKYNSSSEYYNDICSKTTSNSGTDISLKDRRNEFVDNNMSLCEENCELIDYNHSTEKAKCSCDIKLIITSNYDIKFNKKNFFKSFIDINNIFNLNIMKCYQTVLRIKSIIKNYGCYIITLIIILYFITIFIFFIISYIKLKKEINYIFSALKSIEIPQKIGTNSNNIIKKRLKIKKKKKKSEKNRDTKNLNKDKLYLENNLEGKKEIFSGQITQNNEDKSTKLINVMSFGLIDSVYVKKILAKKDFEMNSLDYEDAIKQDHRNYCEYYISLLKNNDPIIFSFSSYKDYNSKIIKIFLFFFSFSLDLTINALFFNDETMHKIYEDKGKFNLLYQLPQIIYSTLIGKLIDSLIRNLALSQDNIIEFKQHKDKNSLLKKHKKLLRILKINFIFFYIISYIVLIFLWYYITCFCCIYANTQKHLIKDSLISLTTSMFIPFVICLVPGIFRIPSLRVEKPSRRALYKFSSLIENYLL